MKAGLADARKSSITKRTISRSVLKALCRIARVAVLVSAPGFCLAAEKGYRYGEQVSILGTIQKRVVAGPPEYIDLAKGDKPLTIYILCLSQPVNVSSIANDVGHMEDPETRVKEMQISIGSGEYRKVIEAAENKALSSRYTIQGSLFHSHTVHHHTPVLITVSHIERAQEKK